MKKLFYSVFALAALASCEAVVMEGDGTNNVISAPKEMVNVTVNVPANESRVAYGDNGSATFEVGDQIAIRVHEDAESDGFPWNDSGTEDERSAYIFTCVSVTDGVAQFEGQLPVTDKNVQIAANFPATLEASGNRWCTVKVPYYTEYTQNNMEDLIEQFHYMRAATTSTGINAESELSFTFQPIGQFFELNITNGTEEAFNLQAVELLADGNYFRVNPNAYMHVFQGNYDHWIEGDQGAWSTSARTTLATPKSLAKGESYKVVIPFFANPSEQNRSLSVNIITDQGNLLVSKGTTPYFNYMQGAYISAEVPFVIEDKDVVDAENLSKTLEYNETSCSIPINLPYGKDVTVELVSLKDSEDNDMSVEYVWTAEINTAASSIDIEANLENKTTKNIVAKFSVACEGKDTQYIYITQKYIDAYFYANTVAGTYSTCEQYGEEWGNPGIGWQCQFTGTRIYTMTEYINEVATEAMKTTLAGYTQGYAIPEGSNVFIFDFDTDTFSNAKWINESDEICHNFYNVVFTSSCGVVDSDKDGNADIVTIEFDVQNNGWKIYSRVYTK